MRFRPAAGRIPYRRIVAKPHSAVGAGSGVGSGLLLQCQLWFHIRCQSPTNLRFYGAPCQPGVNPGSTAPVSYQLWSRLLCWTPSQPNWSCWMAPPLSRMAPSQSRMPPPGRMAFCRPSPAGSGPARVICGRRGTGSCRADARYRGCSCACGACSDPGRRHIRRG